MIGCEKKEEPGEDGVHLRPALFGCAPGGARFFSALTIFGIVHTMIVE